MTPVGHFTAESGTRFLGRVRVTECPEGLALKWRHVIAQAEMAIAHGLPDGRPFNQQDHRLMQAIEVVRELRAEE